ncbi:hypothetical protein IMZ08_03620 [Bacillus luteolus]|uniref:IrrE N-terminal-like domain-containing protein n=1 Tax=Litchfieldia luteola TaxID=682179 RepID=A0ABR9QF74_9BACI|nr:ImmA/IrrE family metallo-endopeptidase [Cytobacillus luteolus]MBE4907147.1 hypothetical protein [Cytobacillus luteolus]MBP1943383.1 hypothetical protein [Cytobacillus luteolus]
MIQLRHNYLYLLFLVPAIILTYLYITPPEKWNLQESIILFLCIMVIFDQINRKVFSGFGYSFFHVILSLIIFDEFSIVYGIIYLTFDFVYTLFFKKRGSVQTMLTILSIYVIIIVICNEFYNVHADEQSYATRYVTLLLMLGSSLLFKYVYVSLETGFISTKLFLDQFAPMVFEVVIIFPILAFFTDINVNLILILFLSYYTFIGFFHKKFMSIEHSHILKIIKILSTKYNIQILFMDLKEIKGMYHSEKRIICIDEKLDYPEQLQTIIHELLHFQLRKKYQLPRKVEEMLITLFEAIISWYYIITLKRM